jgi:cell division protein FtsB
VAGLLIQLCIYGLALFGLVIAIARWSGYVAVVWWDELDDLEARCHSLDRENSRLRAQIRQLTKLGAIDEVARSATHAMLQVAAEERRTIEHRRSER